MNGPKKPTAGELTGAMRSTVTGLLDEAYVQGVADERARVVAFLRAADSECLVWFAAQRIEQGWHERFECVPNLDNGGE